MALPGHPSPPTLMFADPTEDVDASKSAPAFLEKLYDILEDPTNDAFISWHDGGKSVLIKEVDGFSRHVLPKHFKHSNFQSFVRQLNMYAFSKTKHDPNWREFRQPNFHKGKRGLLKTIKRKSADSNAMAKQTRSKVEEMLADLDKLRQDVTNAKGRLGLVEAHLWMTTDKCNAIQAENQSLWKILADNAPQLKTTMRTDAGEAADVAAATGVAAAHGVEVDATGGTTFSAASAAYANRFQQIHNALRSLPTAQLPMHLTSSDAATLAAAVQSAAAPVMANGVVEQGLEHQKREHEVAAAAAAGVVGHHGLTAEAVHAPAHAQHPGEEPAAKKKRVE